MGRDALRPNFPYDPWCNTCGKDISMATWNENDGECDACLQWWNEQGELKMPAGGKTWVISDPHFGHANILKFMREDGVTPLRDFPDVEAMDEALIANWNGVVGQADRVYLLGDVAFHPRVFERIIPRLAGRICLVPGNHEPEKSRRYFHLFDDVRGYVVKKGFIMSHIPIHPGSLSRWQLNIHGHLHANVIWTPGCVGPNQRLNMEKAAYEHPDPRYYCACVEQIGYTPKLLDDILKERGVNQQ